MQHEDIPRPAYSLYSCGIRARRGSTVAGPYRRAECLKSTSNLVTTIQNLTFSNEAKANQEQALEWRGIGALPLLSTTILIHRRIVVC